MCQLAHDRHAQQTVAPFLAYPQQVEIETHAIIIYAARLSFFESDCVHTELVGL